jgi:hypothetical protein
MGASIRDAKSALESLPDVAPSPESTHPPKNDRLAAVGSGWGKACDADPRCASGDSTLPPTRPPANTPAGTETAFPTSDKVSPPIEIVDGPNSCEFAHDDECDEPNLCERGTDTADCSQARETPVAASVCATMFGACPMVVEIVPGSSCTCYTAFGPIGGVAR